MIPARLGAFLAFTLAACAAPAAAGEKLALNIGGATLLLASEGPPDRSESDRPPPQPLALRAADGWDAPPPLLDSEEEMSQLLALAYPLSGDGLWQSFLGAALTERPLLRGVVEGGRTPALQFAAGIGYGSENRFLLYGGWRYLEPEVGKAAEEHEVETGAHRIEGGFRLRF